MSRLLQVLLIAAAQLTVTRAVPQFSSPSSTFAPPDVQSSNTFSPSESTTSSSELFTTIIWTPLPTAHTEKTTDLLQVPSSMPAPASATSDARTTVTPGVPHQEKSQSALVVPEPQVTSKTIQDNAPISQQAEGSAPISTGGVIVYYPHTEVLASVLQAATYAAPGKADNAAPTQESYGDAPGALNAVVYTSNNVVYTTNNAVYTSNNAVYTPNNVVYASNNVVYTAPIAAQQTTAAPVLNSPPSGAVGVFAGSSAVVMAGTTYSLAAGGSVLYINGVSSSVSATSIAVWSTSNAVVFSNGITVSVSGVAVAGSVKATGTSLSLRSSVATSKAASSGAAGASSTSTSGSLATGAASTQAFRWVTFGTGLVTSVVGLIFL